MNHKIWVFIECYKNGKPKSVGLELLNKALELKDKNPIELVTIIFGYDIHKTILEIAKQDIDKIIYIDAKELQNYKTRLFTNIFCQLIDKYKPETVLIGATSTGRDLAPRMSCKLQTGLTADCTNIEMENDTILWTRPTFGGNLMATIICPKNRPQMGTIRPGVFKKSINKSNNNPIIIKEELPETIFLSPIEILEEFTDIETGKLELAEAKIIVAGGMGVKDKKGFELLQELSNQLGATLAASRAAVDANLISRIHQVGQTGKTVNAKIYIACGISGAIQHLVGIKTCDTIIAINNDEEAPIFSVADYKIIGDLFTIIPALIDALKKKQNTL